MVADRLRIPTETEVMVKSRRRCCLCFGIDNNLEEKQGQIAHLDKNKNNNNFDNLAFLCLKHHDKFDSTTSQSKNYTKNEVKIYRNQLYEYYDKMYSNKFSSCDYFDYLNNNIIIIIKNHQFEENKVIIEVDNIELMEPKLINFELWNKGELELIINKIEMRNRLMFNYSEHWMPLPLKGFGKDNTLDYLRYINKNIINFEIEPQKYINLSYYFPQLRINLVKKYSSLQFDFDIQVTIPSKSFNYEISDIKRDITKTIFFDFQEKVKI